MNAKEIFEAALALVAETPEENADIRKFAVKWCNFLLAESKDFENAARRAKSLPEREKAPVINSESEEIPFDEEILRRAFPYGMARWILASEDEHYRSAEFNALWLGALRDAVPFFLSEVENIY